MALVSRILAAAYCNGTHHRLAFHALDQLESPNAASWKKLFQSNLGQYLKGSKAPDKVFKDFKNHVLHVRHNLWGGAPTEAKNWYQQTVSNLRSSNWGEAAYCAGVLSHYLTDPLMPFHTDQSQEETNIHRAFEWSVSKAYPEMHGAIKKALTETTIHTSDSENWLEESIIVAAHFSNQDYEQLIEEYDFEKGVDDPPKGLNTLSRERLAQHLAYAQLLHSHVLDRAIEEAGVTPPKTNLTAKSVFGLIQIPIYWVLRKISDLREKNLVAAMYKEYLLKGIVDKTLTEDVRVIRDLVQDRDQDSASPHQSSHHQRQQTSEQSNLAEAPSIGKRTAEHLSKVGITSIEDFLKADPVELADKVARDYMDTETLTNWQDQARMACRIPRLRGHDIQILVGSGIRSASEIAKTEPKTLLEKVLPFVESSAGKKVVRPGDEPDLIEIQKWIEYAGEAESSAA